jgi:hypothetical protein
MFVAMSSGLLIQAFNTELPGLLAFATLKLGESEAGQERKTQMNDLTTTVNGSSNNKYQGAQFLKPAIEPTVLLTPLQNASPGIYPDDDCLFDPSLPKCSPMEGECPAGFLMNEDEQCFPDKPCPVGFTKHDEDETGACYPVGPTTPLMTNGTNVSTSDGRRAN